MNTDQIVYLFFGIILIVAIVFDLGLLSKKSSIVSVKKAMYQTIFWVSLAMIFFGFILYEMGQVVAIEYLSAYLMEWSLSLDNIFVFILIFGFLKIPTSHVARALLLGILMAIIFRIVFITVGVVLVEKFSWLLYVFGAFLLYTGIKIFAVKHDTEYSPATNPVYRILVKIINIDYADESGKFIIKKNGKRFFTNMFIVIILLATTDIVFALDSIPAVFAISQNKLVIYTSNIFAVLGLRSLFFLLKGAVNKFAYLQQGIAIILIFIGLKMLAEIIHIKVPVFISLIVIIICLTGSIAYSVQENNKEKNE